MKKRNIFLGNTNLVCSKEQVKGGFVEKDGERCYKISNYDQMPDFFMSIVSDSNHWMFISSNGSLSAGRKDRDNALFPYYTVDKIHDYKGITGSYSAFLVSKGEKTYLWIPFSESSSCIYNVRRNLYKSVYGNKIFFEEHNRDLEITFSYSWNNSERFGFVKKASLHNFGTSNVTIKLLDGIQNVLPSGVGYAFQNEYSNLADGYKKNELLDGTQIGMFMLSSIPVDKAEPSESLRCTSVFSVGFKEPRILLSNNQVSRFKSGQKVESELDIRATRGAYLINEEINLTSNSQRRWQIVAEINQDSADVVNLVNLIEGSKTLDADIDQNIKEGTEKLVQIISDADGLQLGSDKLCTTRHFSNTLFNVMRGGIFRNHYDIRSADLQLFINQSNRQLAKLFEHWLDNLPRNMTYLQLLGLAENTNNADLIRICREYLPLTFSRRHGDPSRPWNLFSIDTKNEDGTSKLNYQGNWRDIFQNWEALAISYPYFIEGMISKFVNASTANGYNPYRITREGIDWECPNPEDPWAYIGYWGDHQIIYLQKFLEISERYLPSSLNQMLIREEYVYANVPYRIKPYQEIIKNPQETIEFDFDLNDRITEMYRTLGADAKLLHKAGMIYKVNLTEKILVTMLSKLSNFIPEAGIWLNTQRPEWNDANNALVGNGVSMVTLYYLRRFLKFWEQKFDTIEIEDVDISVEVFELFNGIYNVFDQHKETLQVGFSDIERREMTDQLGELGTEYRNTIYANGFRGVKRKVEFVTLKAFASLALTFVEEAIRHNRREDGLYHAYNLVSFKEGKITIRNLYEMLEGQVAVLSSGYLSDEESLSVLDALKESKLFRDDQYSYMLYPDKRLARFVEKNNIPHKHIEKSALLTVLSNDPHQRIIKKDAEGNFHFRGSYRNARILDVALNNLGESYNAFTVAHRKELLDVYEEIFDHQSFTGRSGTFFAFEGLGSIYWHMVSKLLLAAQECFYNAIEHNSEPIILGRLKEHYYEIKAGIGLYKAPDLYGAFPTDAYSHTPSTAGVQQPGMTGQVKEDFISRMGELGVIVNRGHISFDVALINEDEFLKNDALFEYYNISNEQKKIELNKGQFAFTFCKVPIVYSISSKSLIIVTFNDDTREVIDSNQLSLSITNSIFERRGEVNRIDYFVKV